jgi:N utilization substance protein A
MAVAGVSANRLELLQIADAVAREKNIDKEIVVEAIEEAIQKGAKSRYGPSILSAPTSTATGRC